MMHTAWNKVHRLRFNEGLLKGGSRVKSGSMDFGFGFIDISHSLT